MAGRDSGGWWLRETPQQLHLELMEEDGSQYIQAIRVATLPVHQICTFK